MCLHAAEAEHVGVQMMLMQALAGRPDHADVCEEKTVLKLVLSILPSLLFVHFAVWCLIPLFSIWFAEVQYTTAAAGVKYYY